MIISQLPRVNIICRERQKANAIRVFFANKPLKRSIYVYLISTHDMNPHSVIDITNFLIWRSNHYSTSVPILLRKYKSIGLFLEWLIKDRQPDGKLKGRLVLVFCLLLVILKASLRNFFFLCSEFDQFSISIVSIWRYNRFIDQKWSKLKKVCFKYLFYAEFDS